MSEAKFTKGPWEVFTEDSWHGRINYDEVVIGMDSYIEDPSNYYCSHKIVIDGVETSDKEGMANAHLIAAAPEMYELLNSIHEWSIIHGEIGVFDKEIDNLLAKARGEK